MRPRAETGREPMDGSRPDRTPRPRSAADLVRAVGRVVALELTRVLVVARVRAEKDTALLQALLVLDRPLLGNASADERSDETAGRSADSGSGDRRSDRAGDDEAETREDDR